MNITLTNGCLLIDNSAIEKWRCPTEFDLSFNRRRSLVASKAGRNFGSAMHEGWAVRYRLFGTCPVSGQDGEKILSAMKDWFDKSPEPANDFRNYGHAVNFMAVYNRVYQQEPFKILTQPEHCKHPGRPIIEEPFMLPFAIACSYEEGQWVVEPWCEEEYQAWRKEPVPYKIPIFYTGKIDLGIQNDNGIFSFDHKTAFQFGRDWEAGLMMDGGQRGYCWALGKILGTKATGYIIDGARVRRPSTKSNYDDAGPIDASDFVRLPKWLDQNDLDEWEQDVRSIIQNILITMASNHIPRHRWECVRKFGKCDFYEYCTALHNQREWHLMESGLFEENNWSPLHKANKEN